MKRGFQGDHWGHPSRWMIRKATTGLWAIYPPVGGFTGVSRLASTGAEAIAAFNNG